MRALRVATALVVLALSGAAPAPAAAGTAQSGTEKITSYDVTIDVRPSGRISVVETIDYDFGFQSKHGIFRTIPRRFHHDDVNDRVYPIRNVRVTGSPGTPTQAENDLDGAEAVIKIGDPDRTITGKHRYVIAYDVDGAVNRFEGHDELYWNAIGHEWGVLIEKASVVVRAEGQVSEVACFAGSRGSTLPCTSARKSGREARFTQARLFLYSGVTVVVALPPGYVATPGPILEERWSAKRAFALTPATLAPAAAVLVAGFGWIAYLLARARRDRRFAGEVPGLTPPIGVDGVEEPLPLFGDRAGPVEYAPPKGMTPALMGVLIDERADPLDVTATIVDLAVRGCLRIEELPRKGLFRRRDWMLERLLIPSDLTKWEHALMSGLFAKGPVVYVSNLKNEFHPKLAAIQDNLYDEVVARGWFTRRPDQVRGRWFALAVGLLIAGAALTYVLARFTSYGVVGIAAFAVGLALLVMHHRMPFRTARGSAALAQVLGFRRYLATAEAEQLRFEEREGVFARYLPYAVVLGETERWAKVFADLGTKAQEQLTWYHGPHGWSVGDFTDSMGAFSTSTSGTLASTPSSSGSSGFSGGGFSGGGGGGGGGGSW